jgi:hypothetical protein
MEGYDYLYWSPVAGDFFFYHVAKTSLDYAIEWQAAMPLPADHPDGPRGPIPAVLYSAEHPGSGKGKEKHYWNVPRVRLDPEIEMEVMPTPEQAQKALKLFLNPRPQGRGDDQKGSDEGEAPKKGGRRSK